MVERAPLCSQPAAIRRRAFLLYSVLHGGKEREEPLAEAAAERNEDRMEERVALQERKGPKGVATEVER